MRALLRHKASSCSAMPAPSAPHELLVGIPLCGACPIAEAQDQLQMRVAILPSCALKHMGTRSIYVVAKRCGRRARTLDTWAADRAHADYISEPCWHRQRCPRPTSKTVVHCKHYVYASRVISERNAWLYACTARIVV